MGSRILVVEDNPTNRSLMEYLLTAFGHTVLSAGDGAQGVALARRESPELILMDLQMPVMNGFDAARELKAHPALSKIPIVAVTAFAMVGDREKVLSSGFDGYIAKPIAPETFVNEVQAFLHDQPVEATTPSAAEAETPPPRKRLVLAVDNSRVNLDVIRGTLAPVGYDVWTAKNAREALELSRRRTPDVVLCDVHMPGQSGFDLIEIMKRDEALRRVPFVFLTSTIWGTADSDLAFALGATGFIHRPIEPQTLIAEVDACLRRKVAG